MTAAGRFLSALRGRSLIPGIGRAVQSMASGKDLQPFEAGNQIILYDHHAWKCLTWSFKQVGSDRFHLTSYSTDKELNTASKPAVRIHLVQHERVTQGLA